MRYKFHILCSISLSIVLLTKIFPNYFDSLAILGLIIGSILPDSDIRNSKVFQSPLWLIAIINRYVVLLPASLIVLVLGKKDAFGHRKLLHSLLGLLLLTAFWSALSYILIDKFKLDSYVFIVILTGMVIGYLLHLLEDSVTIDGIEPFYPLKNKFNGKMITGKISLAFWRSEYASFSYSVVILFIELALIPLNLTYFFFVFMASLIVFRIPFMI